MRPAAIKFNFGDAGVKFRESIRAMRQLIDDFKWNPVIRQTALNILSNAGVAQRDVLNEARAIYFFVRDRIRFRRDVVDVETLSYPTLTLANRAGDCDDQVVLLNSLLESVGIPTRMVAISQVPERQFTHVYSQALVKGRWFAMDTINKNEFGYEPEIFTRKAIYG